MKGTNYESRNSIIKRLEIHINQSIIYKLCTKNRLYHFIRVSIPFHMTLIVSQYHDHNERYDPEKRGGVQQKFANREPQLTGKICHQ